jgi:hypothetical protein
VLVREHSDASSGQFIRIFGNYAWLDIHEPDLLLLMTLHCPRAVRVASKDGSSSSYPQSRKNKLCFLFPLPLYLI